MELKKGYKQTDLGVIPNDWEVKKFQEVTNAITCGVAATPVYVQESVGMPFLSASHVQAGRIVYDEYKFITKELYTQITKNNKPDKGDILYTRVGAGIGQAGVIDFDLDFAIYVSLTLIKVKSNIDSNFIKFLLNSNFYQFLAKNGQFAGGGVQNLNVNIVREFPIPLPTKREQTAIATALVDADALISSLEKLIEKKRNIKQGAMQELLRPKGGWVMKNLGEIALFYKGKGLSKSEISEYGKYKCIHYGELFTKHKELIIDIYSNTDNSNNKFLSKENDVLMPTSDVTPNGLAKASCIKENDIILGGDILVIRASETVVDGVFLSYCITYDKEQVMSLVSGSTVFHLYGSDMKKFEIYLPPYIEEQKKIATILIDMSKEITSLEKKLSKIKILKDGMMQELLTGKIRLI